MAKDRDIIGEYVDAWLKEHLPKVLEEVVAEHLPRIWEEHVRKRNLEAFKREMVPPQHWRD